MGTGRKNRLFFKVDREIAERTVPLAVDVDAGRCHPVSCEDSRVKIDLLIFVVSATEAKDDHGPACGGLLAGGHKEIHVDGIH